MQGVDECLGQRYRARQWITNALEVLESVRHAMEDFSNAPTESRAKTAIRNFLEQTVPVPRLSWHAAHTWPALSLIPRL
jgi:hypothetical protein